MSELSDKILERLEETDLFRQAACIALYHAIPGEVQTARFIEKWYNKKLILLPVINGDDLLLFPYKGTESLKRGVFGILEPDKTQLQSSEEKIDLIIIPGVAFDRHRNRLGRGKGYYDRFLSSSHAPKVGICYDFQLINNLPVEPFDKKMDLIITETEVI